jgi:hypothetical protein
MPRINITDRQISERAAEMFGKTTDHTPAQLREAKNAIAQEQLDAAQKPSATEADQGPDHYVVTTEVTHGDRVLSVTQQHVPIPKGNTAK